VKESNSPLGLREAEGGLMFCLRFLFIYFFYDFCQTNYLNIYQTDLHQISRIGRITAADQRSEASFSIPQGTLPWQPIFAGFIDFYPQMTDGDVRQGVQMLRRTQANRLTD